MLASCNGSHGSVIKGRGISLKKSTFQDLEDFKSQDFKAIVKDYQSVCSIINKQNPQKKVQSQEISIGYNSNLKKICRDFSLLVNSDNHKILSYFKEHFTPFLVIDNVKETHIGLFTGYYYPVINVSRTKQGRFIHPIYKRPQNLSPTEPYYTRREIYDGALNGMDVELFWADDMLSLFNLHIQGSGIAQVDDGSTVHISYDGKNNQPYQSIGQYMIKNNISSGKTQKEIDAWLRSHPEKMKDILSINKSYIFFKQNPAQGAIGAHGSSLTPSRSIAVDNKYIPYGAIMYLSTKSSGSGIVFAQDTGSAILGPVRGDIFYGHGESAYNIAEKMKDSGSYYILVPKE